MTHAEMAQANKKRDDVILRFIYEHRIQHGYPPALMEIGGRFGISRSMAFDAVARLQERGMVVKGKHQSNRAIALTSTGLTRLGLTENVAQTGTQCVPVLHSTEALRRWLEFPAYREFVSSVRALAEQVVELREVNR